MREDDGVGLRMRQIERPAQRMAELVMQRHADGAEADAAEPGAIERVGARGPVIRLSADLGQRMRQRADALLRHQRYHGVAIPRVERLDRMRDGVDARCRGQARRHRHGEVDVVDHDLGENFRARLRGLDPAAGLADDRRHLRAGVAGRQHDLRQVGAQGDRLAEAGGRTAADRHETIGPHIAHGFHRPFRHLNGRVHDCAREDAGEAFADHRPDVGDQVFLSRRRQHKRAGDAEAGQFVGQLAQRAGAEHHPHRRALVDEVLHGCSLRTKWPAPGSGRPGAGLPPRSRGGLCNLAQAGSLFKAARWGARRPPGQQDDRRRLRSPQTPIDRNIGVGLW